MSTNPHMLKEKISAAPRTPGCYLFYDRMGYLIYVGKSKCLQDRVRSYFTPSAKDDERIAGLIREIADVGFVHTETELDALIEEYRLIKRHKPWFNAQHIRNWEAWFLGVRLEGSFPVVEILRDMAGGFRHTVGPFKDAFKAEEAMRLFNRAWRTPLCGKGAWPAGSRPCLFNDMGKCFAPCCEKEGQYPYRDDFFAFLEGRPELAFSRLRDEMASAAVAFRFEEANGIKKTLGELEHLAHRVQYGFHITPETHAALLMRGFGERDASVFYIAQGRIRNRVRLPDGISPEEAKIAFSDALCAGEAASFEHPLMESCLSEISAFRRFIMLAPDEGRETISDAFSALYTSYMK